MADIIDSFVVTLGLDPTNYHKETAKFRSDFKRLKEDGHSTALSLESDGKRAANYFASLKNEVIGVVLAIAGARSMGGLIVDMVNGAAATGRLAGNLGIATDRLGAWQLAVQSVGGTAADANQALQQMVDAYQTYRLTGTTGHDADFQGLGIRLNDLQNPEQALLRIASAGERLGRPEFAARLQRIGLSPSAIVLLERGRRSVQGLTDDFQRNGAATQRDAEAAQQFEMDWTRLTAQLRTDLRPMLTWLIEQGLPFLESHMGEVAGAAAGLGIGIAALTFEIWAIPAAVAAAGAALVWLGDRFHALDAWRDFALHLRSLRLEGELLGIPNDARDESVPLAIRREHAARRLALQIQLQDIADERLRLSENVAGVVPPMPTGAPGAAPSAGGRATYSTVRAELVRQGLSDAQAAGLAAHIMAESGGNISAFNAAGGGLGAAGIFQWRGARQRNYIRMFGHSPRGAPLAEQIRFLLTELRGGDPGGRAVLGAQTAEQALAASILQFGRPAPGMETTRDFRVARSYLNGGGGAAVSARAGTSSGAASVHIGSLTVYTPHGTTAAQAEAVAREIPRAVARRNVTTQANSGLR